MLRAICAGRIDRSRVDGVSWVLFIRMGVMMCRSMRQQLTLERGEVTGRRQHFAQVHYDCECLTRYDVCLTFSYRDLRSGDSGYFQALVPLGSHPDRLQLANGCCSIALSSFTSTCCVFVSLHFKCLMVCARCVSHCVGEARV